MIVTISIICVLLAVLYCYLRWPYDYWTKRGVPGPSPTIVVGNFKSTLTQKNALAVEMDDIYRTFKGKSNIIGIYNMRSPHAVILNPAVIKEVTVSKFHCFHDNEMGTYVDADPDPILAQNPAVLNGEAWKKKRAEISPAFTSSRVEAMYPIMESVCQAMVEYLGEEVVKRNNADGIETCEMAACYTTDVVSNCIFAFDAQSFKHPDAPIRKMGAHLMQSSTWMNIYFLVASIFPCLDRFYKMPFVSKRVQDFFIQLMSDALHYRETNKIVRADFLDYLQQLKAKKNLSNLDLTGHAMTFFLDGYETSSLAMAYMLYELARNPRVQDKLRAQLEALAQTKEGITFKSLDKLDYLDQVFYETLRLHPPAVYAAKICTEACELPLDDRRMITIAKDSTTIIPIYSIHRDEEHFKDAPAFHPERFDRANGGVKSFQDRGVLIPFGDGPRTCLGMKITAAQIKAGVTTIVRQFRLKVNANTKEPIIMDPVSFVNTPLGGIWLDYNRI